MPQIVNGILRPFLQTTPVEVETVHPNGSGKVVLRFFYGLWNRDGLDPGDAPDAPQPETAQTLDRADTPAITPAEKRRRRREEEESAERDRRGREDEQERKDKADDERLMLLLLSADEHHRALKELTDDLDDAIKATRLAHERAELAGQHALDELSDAQRNALVLSDGRRVYFTRDGRRLYAEGGHEITDRGTIDEAKRLHKLRPNATDHETYREKERKASAATQHAEQLAVALHKLDDLKEKVRAGHITPEELERAQEEFGDIVGSLPDDAREDYQRIRAAREERSVPYRPADFSSDSVPNLKAHFQIAEAQQGSTPDAARSDSSPTPVPAYKSAPEF